MIGNRPRVLQINKFYYPHIGGVEKYVQQIAENLVTRGFESRVLVSQVRGRAIQTMVNGVSVTVAASLGTLWSMPLAPSFPIHLSRLSAWADIVHFHLPFPLGDLSHLINPGKRKAKVVVTWHSDIVRQRAILPLYKGPLNRFLNLTDRIILTSPAALGNTQCLAPFRSKCVVIPPGIPDAWFDLSVGTPHDGSCTQTPKTVLFVGRLCYYKGLSYLIDAMRGVDAELVIIGDGDLRWEVEKQIRQCGLQGRVRVMGRCTDEELQRWYRSCDVFVLPSIEPSEAFGLVQVEAMACGKPVVNTSLPTGVPFVSLHGVTGLTVPPRDSQALRDAIDSILRNEQWAKELGRNARHRADELFRLSKMMDSLTSVYKTLLRD